MAVDVSRVVPVLGAHEIRRDLVELFAEAERGDGNVEELLGAPPFRCLDLLWAAPRDPSVLPLARRLAEIASDRAGIVLVAASALTEIVRELPREDRCGANMRRLLAGESLVSFSHAILAFDDVRLPCLGWISARDELVALFDRLERLACQSLPVLVTGETGTGKELAARALHRLGPRRERPWLVVNCAELPEGIFESELFGHARGSFTGASADRPGLLEAAADGTAFLDEVGEMPSIAQAKLLRVLEDHRVRRVGTVQPRLLHCRIIAATNRDLAIEIERGRFRADLFYRLRGAELRLRPLRDRPDDILPTADAFLARAALRFRHPIRGFGEDAKLALLSHPWPGNVRELRQVVDAAVLAAAGEWIRAEELSLIRPRDGIGEDEPLLTIHAAERAQILRALLSTAGNKVAAARLLGLTRQSLQRRLERHRITVPPGSGRARPISPVAGGQLPGGTTGRSGGVP